MTHDGGKFYMIFMNADKEYPAANSDGINWKAGPVILAGIAGTGQPAMYRRYLVPTPDGTKMQVWYMVHGTPGRRVGYTRIPMSYWTALR